MPTTTNAPTTRRRAGEPFEPTERQRREWARTPATASQVAMIERLSTERAAALGADPELYDRVVRAVARIASGELSKLAASQCIDALMRLPRPEGADGARANRYRGRCPQCEGWVAAGAGVLESRDGRWVTLHADCRGEEADTLADDDEEWEAF